MTPLGSTKFNSAFKTSEQKQQKSEFKTTQSPLKRDKEQMVQSHYQLISQNKDTTQSPSKQIDLPFLKQESVKNKIDNEPQIDSASTINQPNQYDFTQE